MKRIALDVEFRGRGWNEDLDMSNNAVSAILRWEIPETWLKKITGFSKKDLDVMNVMEYGNSLRWESHHHMGKGKKVITVNFYDFEEILDLLPEDKQSKVEAKFEKEQKQIKDIKRKQWEEEKKEKRKEESEENLGKQWILAEIGAGNEKVLELAKIYDNRKEYSNKKRNEAFQGLMKMFKKIYPNEKFSPGSSDTVLKGIEYQSTQQFHEVPKFLPPRKDLRKLRIIDDDQDLVEDDPDMD